MAEKIIIDAGNPNFVIVDSKKYILETQTYKKIDRVEHADKVVFKEFNEEDYNRCLDILTDTISRNVTKKEMIREIVKKIDFKSLRRLVKRIDNKKPIKKQKGCLGLKIGDAYIQLFD
jgi:hypothetical protein